MSKETREAALGLRVGAADLFAHHRNGRRVLEAPQPGIHSGLHPKLNGLGRLFAPKGRSKIDKALEVAESQGIDVSRGDIEALFEELAQKAEEMDEEELEEVAGGDSTGDEECHWRGWLMWSRMS